MSKWRTLFFLVKQPVNLCPFVGIGAGEPIHARERRKKTKLTIVEEAMSREVAFIRCLPFGGKPGAQVSPQT